MGAAEKFRVVVEMPTTTTSTTSTTSTTATIIEERFSTTETMKPGDVTCVGEKCKGEFEERSDQSNCTADCEHDPNQAVNNKKSKISFCFLAVLTYICL